MENVLWTSVCLQSLSECFFVQLHWWTSVDCVSAQFVPKLPKPHDSGASMENLDFKPVEQTQSWMMNSSPTQ